MHNIQLTVEDQEQHSLLLRDLREALTHHQIELERFERYIRAGGHDVFSPFELRLQRDMHDRFVTAIGKAIEALQ